MSTPPPFGLILPSRPVITNPTTVSPTQFAFTFPSTPNFSHIVIFLLPGAALPDGTLAGIYIQLPTPNTNAEFKFLGAIGTEKPSAIFKVGQGSSSVSNANAGDEMTDADESPSTTTTTTTTVGDVTVGLSIEPAANITAQMQQAVKAATSAAAASQPSSALVLSTNRAPSKSPLTTKILAQRIIRNAFNFLASFAGSAPAAAAVGGQEVVPLKSFQDWWAKFERRVENDPGFLERDDTD